MCAVQERDNINNDELQVAVSSRNVFLKEGLVGTLKSQGIKITSYASSDANLLFVDYSSPCTPPNEIMERGLKIVLLYESDDLEKVLDFACSNTKNILGIATFDGKATGEQIISNIFKVIRMGGAYYDSVFTTYLVEEFKKVSKYREVVIPEAIPAIYESLTPKEIEIISFILKGYNNKMIADEMILAYNTIKNHISKIFKKMNVANKTDLIITILHSNHPEVYKMFDFCTNPW